MDQTVTVTEAPLPSRRQLALTTLVAMAVAVVILVTIVLPAEYGIDPLGTGEQLGLTAMSRPIAVEPVPLPAGGDALKPTPNGPTNLYGTAFKVDAVEFVLGPYDYVEYKYQLQEGAQMQFSWKATLPVIHDFHGEVNSDPNQVKSFDKSNRQESNAAFTAPFAGIHGWYWENPGAESVTVTLKSSGFYSGALEFRSDKTRKTHELSVP